MAQKYAPLIQAATLRPFLDALTSEGHEPQPIYNRTGLSRDMIDDPKAVAPAPSIYRFAELVAEQVEDPHLGLKIGLDPKIAEWPPLKDALVQSRVLGEFLCRFVVSVGQYATATRFKLEIGQDKSWITRDRGFMPREKPAQTDALGVGMFISIFRAALGTNWRAADMLFKVCEPSVARTHDIGACALVMGDKRTFACSFPSAWLVEPVRPGTPVARPEQVSQPPSDALITTIRSNIRTQMGDPNFNIADLTAQMGLNRKDVQRFLRSRGLGMRELVEEERLAVAVELLAVGGHSLEQVANALGYTDASNFSRSFRRWTGQAPAQWRTTHARNSD